MKLFRKKRLRHGVCLSQETRSLKRTHLAQAGWSERILERIYSQCLEVRFNVMDNFGGTSRFDDMWNSDISLNTIPVYLLLLSKVCTIACTEHVQSHSWCVETISTSFFQTDDIERINNLMRLPCSRRKWVELQLMVLLPSFIWQQFWPFQPS